MVAFLKEGQSKFFEVDSDRFSTILSIFSEEGSSDENELTSLYFGVPFLTISASNDSNTLQLSHINKNNSYLTAKEILTLINHCESIRELSLPYSLLSNELIKALSSTKTLQLDTLRLVAHSETKPVSKVSYETWSVFMNNSPDVNLVLLAYLTESKDYDELLIPQVPLTHLYFGDGVPSSVINRVGEQCPYIKELVIGAYGPSVIDETLASAAKGCPKLSSVGLGDCELTCSGLVKFVSLCSERLKMLYVLDTSLIENSEYGITEVSEKVSSLLGKSWQPDYVPYW